MTTITSTEDLEGQFRLAGVIDEGNRKIASLASHVEAGRFPRVPQALRDALSGRDIIDRIRREQLAPSVTPAQFLASAVTDLMSGQEPTDFVNRAADAWLNADRAGAAAEALAQAESDVVRRLPRRVTEALPELVAGLREQLEVTVDALRAAYAVIGDDVDLDSPDVTLVLEATASKRKAWQTVRDQSVHYRLLRTLQLSALTGSDAKPPGTTEWTLHGWRDVEATGVLELGELTGTGVPGADLARRNRIRAAVTRTDVWMPDLDQLSAAWDQMHTNLNRSNQ